MAEFVKTGEVEQISVPEVKAAESKRQEAGADLYSLSEKDLHEVDYSGCDTA